MLENISITITDKNTDVVISAILENLLSTIDMGGLNKRDVKLAQVQHAFILNSIKKYAGNKSFNEKCFRAILTKLLNPDKSTAVQKVPSKPKVKGFTVDMDIVFEAMTHTEKQFKTLYPDISKVRYKRIMSDIKKPEKLLKFYEASERLYKQEQISGIKNTRLSTPLRLLKSSAINYASKHYKKEVYQQFISDIEIL